MGGKRRRKAAMDAAIRINITAIGAHQWNPNNRNAAVAASGEPTPLRSIGVGDNSPTGCAGGSARISSRVCGNGSVKCVVNRSKTPVYMLPMRDPYTMLDTAAAKLLCSHA